MPKCDATEYIPRCSRGSRFLALSTLIQWARASDAIMRHDSVEIMRDDPVTQTPSLERPSIERVSTSETPDWIPPTPGRAVSRSLPDEASLFVYDERNDILDARREKARARAVSSALEACGDAAQFYRAFLKCSGKGHSVVLLDDVPSGTCVSFANLTVLKRSLACGLDRVDIGGVGDAVLLALFELNKDWKRAKKDAKGAREARPLLMRPFFELFYFFLLFFRKIGPDSFLQLHLGALSTNLGSVSAGTAVSTDF